MTTDRTITYQTISIFKMRTDLVKTQLGRFKESSRIFPDFVLPQLFLPLTVWFLNSLFLKNYYRFYY